MCCKNAAIALRTLQHCKSTRSNRPFSTGRFSQADGEKIFCIENCNLNIQGSEFCSTDIWKEFGTLVRKRRPIR